LIRLIHWQRHKNNWISSRVSSLS